MYNKLQYYNVARYKFTQRPHAVVSECANALEVRCPLCSYMWKRCEVLSLRKRGLSQEMDLCSMMCASPNAKVQLSTHIAYASLQ